MEELSQAVKEMAICLGAVAAGISTTETLHGGPPSADLSYVLPNAKSAISFALPLDHSQIEAFLKKEDRLAHQQDNVRATLLASGIALDIAGFLEQKGHRSVPVAANFVYRTDTKNGPADLKPPIAHRYLAVRSGIGHFGHSGNVIREKEGAAIILGSVVTEADLVPTDPLPKEANYCDSCRLCDASCASGFMDQAQDTTVTLGGVDFSYSKRRHHNRCDYVCGGFTGLHRSGKWSTWSPARFAIPENDNEFLPAIIQSIGYYMQRPRLEGGFYNFLLPGYRVPLTCGNCQFVCVADREERKRRHRMLVESGVVVQNPDGSLEAVSPDEARERIAAMSPETRAMYESA
ncbi:MAG: epoxyqueuosine reductase [Dehalococcoidia bacterium]